MFNRFITFEGGDGAGKTTLIKNVKKKLEESGYSVVLTREPGSSSLGEKIREILLHKREEIRITPIAELLLFLTARAEHIEEVIKPSLKSNLFVLCDRFNDSTIAYQGVARGLGFDFVQHFCDEVCQEIQPSLTIYLDLDPIEAKKRIRGKFDGIEKEKNIFHEKVREGFLELCKRYPTRIYCLDASESIEEVFEKTISLIFSRFNLR